MHELTKLTEEWIKETGFGGTWKGLLNKNLWAKWESEVLLPFLKEKSSLRELDYRDLYKFLVDFMKADLVDKEMEKILNQKTYMTATEINLKRGMTKENCLKLSKSICQAFGIEQKSLIERVDDILDNSDADTKAQDIINVVKSHYGIEEK